MCNVIINMEYATGANVRMYPVVKEMGRGGQLQKKFGDRATILGVGLKGPRKHSLEEQLDRTRELKINLCNNLFGRPAYTED